MFNQLKEQVRAQADKLKAQAQAQANQLGAQALQKAQKFAIDTATNSGYVTDQQLKAAQRLYESGKNIDNVSGNILNQPGSPDSLTTALVTGNPVGNPILPRTDSMSSAGSSLGPYASENSEEEDSIVGRAAKKQNTGQTVVGTVNTEKISDASNSQSYGRFSRKKKLKKSLKKNRKNKTKKFGSRTAGQGKISDFSRTSLKKNKRMNKKQKIQKQKNQKQKNQKRKKNQTRKSIKRITFKFQE